MMTITATQGGETKPCLDCGIPKPLSEFHRTTNRALDGRLSYCKACMYERTRRYRQTPRGRLVVAIAKIRQRIAALGPPETKRAVGGRERSMRTL